MTWLLIRTKDASASKSHDTILKVVIDIKILTKGIVQTTRETPRADNTIGYVIGG